MEEKKVPALRFRGFDNAWEQRRFKELFEEKREKTVLEWEDVLLSCAITGIYLNSELFSHFRGTSTIGYLKIKKNDLILSAQNLHLGNANVNLYFESGIISPAYKVFSLVNCDPLFVQAWVKREATNKFFLETTTEGASQCRKNIEWNTLDKQLVSVPTILEGHQIGRYFSQLDHLISLHQRKLEMLKKVKKSMLEKMFPKNDAKVPEVRFSDFTDAWEHCKLGDVFEQTSNLVTLGNGEVKLWSLTVEDGLTPKTERYNREFLVKKDDKFKEVRPGDIVYNPMNMTLGAVGYNGMTRSVAVSGYYTTMIARENYDAYYINTWLKSSQAIKLYKIYATGSLIEKQRVQFPTLSIISASFPRDEEQKQIGEYFRNLDHLISLHQRKLEKLKNIKKSMLEKMFI